MLSFINLAPPYIMIECHRFISDSWRGLYVLRLHHKVLKYLEDGEATDYGDRLASPLPI